jgi:AraC-like DNA-binding protein
MIHRGEIVEKIVRKSGYSLAKISAHLDISRNTLYNRFKEANLNYQFISAVGKLIHHDFTIAFPEMKEDFSLESQNPISKVESKYTRLLEKYNKLLGIVMVISDDYALHKIRQEIAQLAETEKE